MPDVCDVYLPAQEASSKQRLSHLFKKYIVKSEAVANYWALVPAR
jgi:hypothetical protein